MINNVLKLAEPASLYSEDSIAGDHRSGRPAITVPRHIWNLFRKAKKRKIYHHHIVHIPADPVALTTDGILGDIQDWGLDGFSEWFNVDEPHLVHGMYI